MKQKNLPPDENGIVHLALPFLFLLLILVALVLLAYFGVITNPFTKNLQNLVGKKEPTVTLQKQYTNPFDKSSQYINPFAEYKNPFDVLKNAK